jgi:Rod binding domain-containing protein
MLVETYAEKLAEKGGFGLADQMYRQLKGQLK